MKNKSISIQLIGVVVVALVITSFLFTHPVTAEGSFFQSPPTEPTLTPTLAIPTATLALPTEQPTLSPLAADPTPEALEEEASPKDSNFIFDQAEFIDSVVIFFSWIWLCCGVALFLAVPLIFLLLQIRGRVKLNRQRKTHGAS